MNGKIIDIVLASLVADTYSLGAHWIYSQEQLKNSQLDWNNLNDPLASWHVSKGKGDFTHYGDQTILLYEYIKHEEKFEPSTYIYVWKEYMDTYTGYKDGSTKDTVLNLTNNQNIPCGSDSHDFSIVGRIAPLLQISESENIFLKNVSDFVSLTHNNEEVLESADFFAKVLWQVFNGESITQSINNNEYNYSQRLQNYVSNGLKSTKNSIEAINDFGSACPTNGSFQGVIYILNKYGNDFKSALVENAKAGGDSSSRAMVIAMIMVASYGKEIIPKNWINQMKYNIT